MTDAPGSFAEKARTKRLTVSVVGLGYVGLPLAVGVARAGVRPDPHVPEVQLDGHEGGDPSGPGLPSVPLDDTRLHHQDGVCLAVAHRAFDGAALVKESPILADATGATWRVSERAGTVIRL